MHPGTREYTFLKRDRKNITKEETAVSMHMLRRRPFGVRVIRGRSLLRGAAGILAAAVALRLLIGSAAGAALENWLTELGNRESFVMGVLGFEAGRFPEAAPTLFDVLADQSSLLAAYEPQARLAMADAGETPYDGDEEADALSPAPENTGIVPKYRFDAPDFTPGASPTPPPAAGEPPEGIVEITFDPSGDNGYDAAEGVYVNNETGLSADVAGLLKQTPPLSLKKDAPQILIIHTHGSEAFTPDAENSYTPTDVERTEDTRFNVVRLGDEMASLFEEKGLSVIHDRNIYDAPSYTGSYGRSLDAITKIIRENPSVGIVIDIHRDSIQTEDGQIYKTVADIDGEKTAQMMLVMGTNDSGLTHPDWKQNLTLAVTLQKKLNGAHPTLMRPINLRRERFNQHATTGSMILEVGSSGNTLSEALAAVRLFSEVAGDYFVSRLK